MQPSRTRRRTLAVSPVLRKVRGAWANRRGDVRCRVARPDLDIAQVTAGSGTDGFVGELTFCVGELTFWFCAGVDFLKPFN